MITPMVILPFKTSTYARNCYIYGITPLDSLTENYYIPVQQYAATNAIYGKSVIENAIEKGYITDQQYNETLAYIPLTTPSTPIVSADNTNNVIVGANETMEIALDGETTYTAYNATTPPNLSGEHTINVRYSAVPYVSTVSTDIILTFTSNSVVPTTPIVSADDVNNIIIGADASMEVSIDNGVTFMPYDPQNLIDLSGDKVVFVRIMAEGLNTFSNNAILTFTTNIVSVEPVTPDAPTVTNNDITNTVTGVTTGMEYKLDDAEYVTYDEEIFNTIDFSGEHTLLVRVAAEGINPFSVDTTLTFTTN